MEMSVRVLAALGLGPWLGATPTSTYNMHSRMKVPHCLCWLV